MGKCLNVKNATLLAVSLAVTGCATVDMTNVASTNNTSAERSIDVNVVQRASAKLYSVFTNRGFVAKDSRRNMRSAARMLLKGLEDKPLSRDAEYSKTVGSADTLKSDIVLATEHVDLTRRAAEVYLAMAPNDTSLKKELGSLQKALMASNEAKQSFSKALIAYSGTSESDDFKAYNSSVEGLRNVTDDFGFRVRSLSIAVSDNKVG